MLTSLFRLKIRSSLLITCLVIALSACSAPEFYLKNDLLIKEGKSELVINDYKRRLKQDNQNPQLYYKLAEAQFFSGQLSLAKESIKTAILLEPQVDSYQFLAGQIAFGQSDFFNAITHLTNTILLNSRNLEAYYILAQAYGNAGRSDKAVKQLERAIALEPLYFKAHLLKYDLEYKSLINQQTEVSKGDEFQNLNGELSRQKGVQLLNNIKQTLKLFPRSLDGNLLLSQVYDSLGMRNQGIEVLNSLLEEYPQNDRIFYQTALFHYKNADFGKAVRLLSKQSSVDGESKLLLLKARMELSPENDFSEELKEMVKTSPELFELYCVSAENDLKKGKLVNAEIAAQQCIALKPERAEGYFTLFSIMEKQNNVYGAQWALRKAYSLKPWDIQIRLSYITNLLEQKELTKAESAFNHPSLPSGDSEVMFVRALLLKSKGEFEKAIGILKQLETLDYSTKTALTFAELEILSGKYESAEQRLSHITDSSDSGLKRDLVVAKLYQKTDRHTNVSNLLRKHQQSPEGKGQVHILLAESSMMLGDLKRAITFCSEGLHRWPKHLELIQYYTFLLGLDGQYDKAIRLLEKAQSADQRYNELFFHRLRQYYYRTGNRKKLDQINHPKVFIKK